MAMVINFPKNLRTDKKGIEFLAFLWGVSKKIYKGRIIWNLKYTKKIETNLLSFLGLIARRMDSRNNIIEMVIRDSNGMTIKVSDNILTRLFKKYSSNKNKLLEYNFLDENNSKEEIEILLLKNLEELKLLYYSDIKILLSEFIANIFMHATDKEGSMSGYMTDKDDILISVCNIGRTIKQNIESVNEYKFLNDKDAILWALKKNNSTRNKEESGGLGLYLLRKYINKIDAEAYIISGKFFISLSGDNCFDENDVNKFYFKEEFEMKSFFPGNLITLKFKNERNYVFNNKVYLPRIDLL
ncbi:hypothetical protein [Clostridium manihotivorum]|uniref:Uncharacterized protein n=1 Tax=Clostridium manihotivorum TaxID=2320868 RepID=A0A3R5U4C0_9CLOT|nr:hypothetical protein [Clostridium manihotivorum]QAA31333.1 hypothetical protein C1I91_06570 [Clostridium manihotivorum]